MAEEIVQRLGFETGDAISNIDLLKTALEGLNSSLAASANAIRLFNSAGGGLDKAIADLTGKVEAMAQKMETGFSNIKPPQLTFDTSAALGQINQLTAAWGRVASTAPAAFKQQFASMKASLADYVNQNNISRDQVIQAFAGTLSGSSPSMNGLKDRVEELKNTFNSTANTAQAAGSKIGGFFVQLGRIIAFRAIISMLNELSQGMQEGVQSAADFSLRIIQIGAIMDDATLSLNQIREALLATSSEFARPLGETTLAFYQTLQNQVGGAAESMYVFQQAAKLSAANVAPLNDSVNLLTAAIKGWNLNVAEAGHLSGMFFEAIKIGRMEASDLADILGRIGPTARQMGISVEEAMGAVAIMTQQGTKASTAITQLNAIMTALIKPTKDLKQVMQEKWGVENAEQAIAKFGGLMGVLRQLEDITGGTSNEMAKFTANVRAIRAEMGLLGPNADAAEEAISRLKNATEETADAASRMVLDTAGGQYKKSVVELANAWTQFGEKMTGTFTTFNRFKTALVEWASTGSAQILILSAGILGVVIALRAYAGAMGVATVATFKWIAAMMMAHPLLAAFAIGAGIGLAISSMMESSTEKMRNYFNDLDKRTKEATETTTREVQKQTNAVTDGYKTRLKEAMATLSKINQALQSEVDAVKRSQAAIIATVKQRFDSILTLEQSYISKLVSAEAEAAQKIEAIKASIETRKGAIADKEFNNNLSRWGQERQWQMQLTRGDELRTEALMKLAKAKTPEDLKVVEELLSRAQSYYDKSAAGTENDRQAYMIRQKSIQVDKDRMAMEEKTLKLLDAEKGSREGQIGKAQELLTTTTALFKAYEEGLKKISSAKTPEEMKKGAEEVQKAWQGLLDVISQQAPQATDFLGLSKIHNEIVSQLQNLPQMDLKVKIDMESLKAQLEGPMASVSADMQRIIGAKGWTDFGAAIMEARMKLTDFITKNAEALAKANAAGKELTNEIAEASKKMPTGDTLDQYISKLKKAAPEISGAVDQLKAALDKLTRTDPMNTEQFRKAIAEYNKAIKDFVADMQQLPKNDWNRIMLSGLHPEEFLQVLSKLSIDIRSKMEEINKMDPIKLRMEKASLEADIQTIDNFIEPLRGKFNAASNEAARMPPILTQTAQIVQQIGQALDSSVTPAAYRGVAGMNALKQAAVDALNAVLAAASAAASAGGMTAAYGGVAHLAAGGVPRRWTDTIPAMLSPGEMVINSTAVKQFYPQLQAINAGSKPMFKDRGGKVTNIGDINVNVKGGDTSQKTIKEIGVGLRRAIQRKTLKLD